MNDNLKKKKLKELGQKMKAAGNNTRLLQKLQQELDDILEMESSPEEGDQDLEEAWEKEHRQQRCDHAMRSTRPSK
jgi:hypothetical protein